MLVDNVPPFICDVFPTAKCNAVPLRYNEGAVSVAEPSLRSNILCVPVTLPGLMNASRHQFAVPNPKSSSVGTFTLSSVPSNNIDAVPNFFCAVSNCESPNLLNVFADLFTVVNSPNPLFPP